MDLKDRLNQDLKAAMKNKDSLKKSVITMVRSDIKQWEVDKKQDLEDNDIIEIISKQVKQRKDAISDFEKSQRNDVVSQNKREIEILESYLPKQLSEDEIIEIVSDVVEKIKPQSSKDMGKVMSQVMPKVKGKADGKLVNKIVKQKLNE